MFAAKLKDPRGMSQRPGAPDPRLASLAAT